MFIEPRSQERRFQALLGAASGARGQAKRDPLWIALELIAAWTPKPKRRRRCALPAHSIGLRIWRRWYCRGGTVEMRPAHHARSDSCCQKPTVLLSS